MSGEENLDNLRSRRKVNRELSETLRGISVRQEHIAGILGKLGDTEGSERATISAHNARLVAANRKTRQITAEERLAEEGIPESEWETKNRHNGS